MRITSLLILVGGLAIAGCDQTTDTMDTTDTPSTVPSTSTPSGPDAASPDTSTPGPTTTPGGTDTSSTEPVAPDNTARNERDASGATKLPTDQAETPADRQITQEIRQKITNDETMSFNARNVKIVTAEGKVTLRGVVDDADEKQAIEKFAAEIAKGQDNVTSEIEVVNR
jgi:hypothetical protein